MDRRNRPIPRLLPAILYALGLVLLAALPSWGTEVNNRSRNPYGYLVIAQNNGTVDSGPIALHGCLGNSTNAGTVYIQFFDQTTAVSPGTAPSMAPVTVAATSAFAWDAGGAVSRWFSNGVKWAESSTRDTYTAVAGTDITMSCQYN